MTRHGSKPTQVHQQPNADGVIYGTGPVREGQEHAYGTLTPRLRTIIRDRGIVEPRDLWRELGVKIDSISSSLDREVKAGRAVKLWRGVYARPDVADAVRSAIRVTMAHGKKAGKGGGK